MSKLLLEALKQVDEKIMTDEVAKQIQEAFDSEVEKATQEKVKSLQESLEKATEDMSKTILESFVLDQKELFEKAVEAKADEMSKDGLEKLQEEANAKMEADLQKIEEDVEKYVKYTADKFMEENKVAMMNEVAVEKANAIMESANIFASEFQKELHEITDEDENKAKKALDESVDKVMSLETELKIMKAEKVLDEACKGLTLVQADKLNKLCESVDIDDLEAFGKQVESIKEALIVPEQKPSKKVDELANRPKRSWE